MEIQEKNSLNFYFFDKIGIIDINDRLNDSAIDISNVYAQEGSHDQKNGQIQQIQCFFAFPRWNHDSYKFPSPFKENHVHLSLALFTKKSKFINSLEN